MRKYILLLVLLFAAASVHAQSVGFQPTSITFGNQTTGVASMPQTIVVTNTGSSNLVFTSNASIGGTNSGDFGASLASTCASAVTVTPGSTCNIVVTFTPSAAGARSATVSISDNASGSPHSVPLSGTGIAASNQIIFCPATANCKVVGQITMSTGQPTLPPSVSIAPLTGSVQINQTFPLVATITNDPSNQGVIWTVSGTNCTGAACGTISPTTSASQQVVTYTAPPTSPAGNIVITAAAIVNPQASFQSNLTVITPTPPPVGPNSNNVFTPSCAVNGTTKTCSFTGYLGPTMVVNLMSVNTSAAITGVQACISGTNCSALTLTNSIDLSGVKKTYQYRGINIGSGFNQVVVTASDANPINVSIHDISNTGSFDTSVTKTGTATTNPTGPSITTATPNEIVVCALGTTGTASAISAPFTFNLTGNQDASASTVNATASAISPSWTTTSATYAALCGAYNVGTIPPAISVVNNPLSASVQASSTQAFRAAVGNDPANQGVDWTCAPIGSCGSFSPTHTASGSATTWTAPALVPPGAAVTLLQHPKGLTQTNPATFPISASTAGSTLCVFDEWNTTTGTMTVSDSKGETWGAAIDAVGSVAGRSAAYDCLPNNVGGVGSITVTVTGAAPTGHEWFVREYSGTLTSNVVDKFTHATGSASPMDSGFMAATTNATNLLIGYGINGAVSTFTTGNDGQGDNYGNLDKQTFFGSAVEDFFTTSATNTYKATLIPDVASGSAMFAVALKAGTGSGTGNSAITITSTSTADTTKLCNSTVTLTTATPPISVVVNPTSGTLTAGTGTISITPTVNDGSNVNWTLNGQGSISLTTSASGVPTVYTPPATVNTATNAVITATSVSDPTKSASASILVNPPTGSGGGGGGGGTAVCSGGNCPAFAGALGTAQGGGAASVGGSGRGTGLTPQVFLITNLNDSGTGSVRACGEASGPRFCIFRISGTLIQKTQIRVSNPYLYVAGQTVPGGGFVQGGPGNQGQAFFVATHDVVIRYMTFDGASFAAAGSTCNHNNGTVGIELGSGNVFNVVVDHQSHHGWQNKDFEIVSNGPGQNVHDVTMQWNMGYEPCTEHPVLTEPDVFAGGSQFASVNQDWHHNFFSNGNHRYPLLAIRSLRWVNNLVYNTLPESDDFNWSSWGAVQGDIIGSKWVDGPQSSFHVFNIVDQADPTFSGDQADCDTLPSGSDTCDNGPKQGRYPGYYLVNNSGHAGTNTGGTPIPFTHSVNDAGQLSMFAAVTNAEGAKNPSTPPGASNPNGCGGPSVSCWFRNAPLPAETYPITADPGENLDAVLLSTVGNSQALNCDGSIRNNRDSQDSRVINQYKNHGPGGAWGGPDYNGPSLGNSPAVPAGTLCAMTFSTGLYDAWIQKYGLPTNDPNLWKKTDPKSGYLYIEDFLNVIVPTHP